MKRLYVVSDNLSMLSTSESNKCIPVINAFEAFFGPEGVRDKKRNYVVNVLTGNIVLKEESEKDKLRALSEMCTEAARYIREDHERLIRIADYDKACKFFDDLVERINCDFQTSPFYHGEEHEKHWIYNPPRKPSESMVRKLLLYPLMPNRKLNDYARVRFIVHNDMAAYALLNLIEDVIEELSRNRYQPTIMEISDKIKHPKPTFRIVCEDDKLRRVHVDGQEQRALNVYIHFKGFLQHPKLFGLNRKTIAIPGEIQIYTASDFINTEEIFKYSRRENYDRICRFMLAMQAILGGEGIFRSHQGWRNIVEVLDGQGLDTKHFECVNLSRSRDEWFMLLTNYQEEKYRKIRYVSGVLEDALGIDRSSKDENAYYDKNMFYPTPKERDSERYDKSNNSFHNLDAIIADIMKISSYLPRNCVNHNSSSINSTFSEYSFLSFPA